MHKNKLKLLIANVLFFIIFTPVYSQTEVELEQVEVSAARSEVKFIQAARSVTVLSKDEIENAPVRNLNELLEFIGNVDVRQRGQNGIQADISLRGSSFEQVLILINGIKMTDPQTGHHNLNLPLTLLDIERIEVLHGGAARVYGAGAFAGAINIITKNPDQTQARIQLIGGQNGLQLFEAAATLAEKKHSHTISWQTNESDGFIRNTDYSMRNIFWQSEAITEKSKWKFNFGQNEKSFGAQNFYTARFPDQFEETKTQFTSLSGSLDIKALEITPRAYYRKHNDRFELFREGEGYFHRLVNGGFANNEGDTIPWYNGHNYHETEVFGAEVNVGYTSKWGKTSVGFDFRREEILSNILGVQSNPQAVKNEHPSATYLRADWRENKSLFIEHNYTQDKLFISAGALINSNSEFGEDLYPGIDISYQLSDNITPYASVNRSFRFPTYTDLYYNLGGAVGSINLETEESINYEAGIKFRETASYGHLSVFRRDGKNLIDWIRYNGSNITQAANLTNVLIDGFEMDYVAQESEWMKNLSPIHQFRVSYSYLTSDNSSNGFESNYVLDFLRHKGDASIQFKLLESLFLNWNFSYQDRKGSYFDENGVEQEFKAVVISDVKLSTQQKELNLFLQASNLFGERYFDIGNVENPGRWISAGLRLQFDVKNETLK